MVYGRSDSRYIDTEKARVMVSYTPAWMYSARLAGINTETNTDLGTPLLNSLMRKVEVIFRKGIMVIHKYY